MNTDSALFSKKGMTVCFAAVILVFALSPLVSSTPAPFWFQEHFFNTLKIVENARATGTFSFDGVTPTNDYSPVWAGILYLLSFAAPVHSAAFFVLARLAVGAALAAALLLLNKLIGRLGYAPEPAARFLVTAFAAACFFYTGQTGADAALAVPCLYLNALLLLKALQTPRFLNGVLFGSSVSLSAAVRFDTLVFPLTAALVFYFQFNRKNPVTTKQLLKLLPALLVGLLPLMIWADARQSAFGTPAPTGLLGWAQSQDRAAWRLLIVLFVEPVRYIAQIPCTIAVVSFPVVLLLLTAYASFPWTGKEQTPADTVFYTLIWHPVLYLAGVGAMTYIALPEYAFYTLAAGAPAAFLFATSKIDAQLAGREKKLAQRVWAALGICFCLISVFYAARPRSAFYEPVTRTVAEFVKTHKGRYAMGAGAGIAAFETGAEFVRLDGMAQDKKMIDFLGAQTDLTNVFKHYGVNYYVAVNPTSADKTCYSAREPVQNRFGGSNKGMSDWLCAAPVFEKQATPKIRIGIFQIDENGKAY